MSIYLGAGSTAHKMSKLYVGVGGQARQVQKVYVGINGQARLVYQSGTPLGNKPVGKKVFFDVDNIRTEWIIVHQGLPGDMYDASCCATPQGSRDLINPAVPGTRIPIHKYTWKTRFSG